MLMRLQNIVNIVLVRVSECDFFYFGQETICGKYQGLKR